MIDQTLTHNADSLYFCGMQSPELTWLIHPAISQAEIARRLSISPSLFAKKLNGIQYKRFNEEEMTRIKEIHQEILQELQ